MAAAETAATVATLPNYVGGRWLEAAGVEVLEEGDLHANGADAFDFYTRTKVVTSRWK